MNVLNFQYEPTEKQRQFHKSKANEVLFGGAAGGGKTYAIVMDAMDLCLRHGGIKAYIFRRSYKELEDNLIPIAREKLTDEIGMYRAASHEIMFKNGSLLRFRQLRNMEDRFKYQGAEINALYIDELTHFTKEEYDFLKSRLRVNKALGFEPVVRCTSNPGGRGHGFVKSYFVDMAPYNTEYKTSVFSRVLGRERVRTRLYIPALVTDNPYIGEDYIFELENKPKAIRDAYLLGKWDAFEGQVFSEWKDDPGHYEDRLFTHVIKPFELPDHYIKFRSFDFGYSRPFSVLWWAVGERDEVYLYKEWYGASAPNVGVRLSPREIAKGIINRDKGDIIKASYADPSIWDSSRGESVALQMEKEGVYFLPGENARISGKMAVHDRLKFDGEGRCGLYVFETCRDFIRTVPALEYDQYRPEDINTQGEDHIYDAMRYFLMNRIRGKKAFQGKPKAFNPLEENETRNNDFL